MMAHYKVVKNVENAWCQLISLLAPYAVPALLTVNQNTLNSLTGLSPSLVLKFLQNLAPRPPIIKFLVSVIVRLWQGSKVSPTHETPDQSARRTLAAQRKWPSSWAHNLLRCPALGRSLEVPQAFFFNLRATIIQKPAEWLLVLCCEAMKSLARLLLPGVRQGSGLLCT